MYKGPDINHFNKVCTHHLLALSPVMQYAIIFSQQIAGMVMSKIEQLRNAIGRKARRSGGSLFPGGEFLFQ